DGDVHRAKVSGAGVPIVDRVAALPTLEVDRVVPGFPARGQRGDHPGGLDTGEGADLREKPVEEPFPVDRLRVERAGQAKLDGENAVGVESLLDVQQSVETARKKTGHDQQRRAQPDLEADQY